MGHFLWSIVSCILDDLTSPERPNHLKKISRNLAVSGIAIDRVGFGDQQAIEDIAKAAT